MVTRRVFNLKGPSCVIRKTMFLIRLSCFFWGGFSSTFADRFIGSGIYDIRISVTGSACAYRCSFCIAITSKAHHDLRPKHLHIAPQQTAPLPLQCCLQPSCHSNGVLAHVQDHAPQLIYMSLQDYFDVREVCEKLRNFLKRCVSSMCRDVIRDFIYGFYRLFDNCCVFLDGSW
jgi:hypothetical protein